MIARNSIKGKFPADRGKVIVKLGATHYRVYQRKWQKSQFAFGKLIEQCAITLTECFVKAIDAANLRGEKISDAMVH